MESGDNRAVAAIDWDEWSRIVEAAQYPEHRDAVQKFLAQADLSADVPPALDEKLLAPRRSAGATGEECAYVLCNLGFASLVAGTRASAEFALACGQLVGHLAKDTPDLSLRRHFLSAKGGLVVAVSTDQPHLAWSDAAERCTAYLRALEHHLEALPVESVEANAMAAYSFAAQFLSRIQKISAVEYYAVEVSQLSAIALELARRLPETFASRMWSKLIPGTDAGVLFRQIGAEAESALQIDEESAHHATTGLKYIEEALSRFVDQAAPELERIRKTRAGLLLASGRHAEAREQGDALERSSDPSIRAAGVAIKARCQLKNGNPQAAAESLAELAPTTEQALEAWRVTRMRDTADRYWARQAESIPTPEDGRNIWRLQAAAAADLQDMPELLRASSRCTGFLVDSLVQDRREWAERLRKATAAGAAARDRSAGQADVADVEPMVVLDEIFGLLVDGSAVLQVIFTDEGILTCVAQKRDGDVSVSVARDRPNVKRLIEAQNSWSRACHERLRHDAGAQEKEDEGAAIFAGLMDEVRRNWGDLLQDLVDAGVTQLILVGDDFIDIPFHACHIDAGEAHLIDRVPVTYVPSLSVLRASLGRMPINASQRNGAALHSLIDSALDSADANAVAAVLGTKPSKLAPPFVDTFRKDVTAARVLYIAARVHHQARFPFESLLGPGWLDLSIGRLLSEFDLARCDVVSNFHCETALPSTLRAPGFDLAAVFLAAGARSVLASTWIANDDLASELAERFFDRWMTGCRPSAAFRDALLSLRSERPALADVDWAGMRLVGAP